MRQSTLLLGLLLLSGGLYLGFSWPRPAAAREEAVPDGATQDPAPLPAPKAIQVRLPAPTPVTSPDSVERMFQMPDGSFLPALNGVRINGEKLAGPYSPVDYRFRDEKGLEWYRLKNGDLVTTVTMPGTEGTRQVMRDLLIRSQPRAPLPDTRALDVQKR